MIFQYNGVSYQSCLTLHNWGLQPTQSSSAMSYSVEESSGLPFSSPGGSSQQNRTQILPALPDSYCLSCKEDLQCSIFEDVIAKLRYFVYRCSAPISLFNVSLLRYPVVIGYPLNSQLNFTHQNFAHYCLNHFNTLLPLCFIRCVVAQ